MYWNTNHQAIAILLFDKTNEYYPYCMRTAILLNAFYVTWIILWILLRAGISSKIYFHVVRGDGRFPLDQGHDITSMKKGTMVLMIIKTMLFEKWPIRNKVYIYHIYIYRRYMQIDINDIKGNAKTLCQITIQRLTVMDYVNNYVNNYGISLCFDPLQRQLPFIDSYLDALFTNMV